MIGPRVSVIIPFTRQEQAQVVLEHLQRQTYPAHLVEILLVGARSSTLSQQYAIKAVETKPIYYPGEARNIGAHEATGTYLLFLDDDCAPAANWIEENIAALGRPGIGAVGGQITGKSRAFFARCVDFSRFGFYQVGREREMVVCSASLGVAKEVFMEVGGFDETLRSEEDMDFCFRLQAHGYRTLYQPAIKVVHDHRRTTLSALLRYSYFYGRVSGLHVKRLYPGLSRRNKILSMVQHPHLYPLMMLPISLGATLNIVRLTVREYPAVLLYAPFIVASKLASHIGIWRWLFYGTHPQRILKTD